MLDMHSPRNSAMNSAIGGAAVDKKHSGIVGVL
jgi:hypothetical protein